MRSDGYIRVTCDTLFCKGEIELELVGTNHGWDDSEVEKDLSLSGWTTSASGLDRCPECSEEIDGGCT